MRQLRKIAKTTLKLSESYENSDHEESDYQQSDEEADSIDVEDSLIKPIKEITSNIISKRTPRETKIIEFFGENNEFLASILRRMSRWYRTVFVVDKSLVEEDVEEHLNNEFYYNYGPFWDLELELTVKESAELTKEQFDNLLLQHGPEKSVNFKLDTTGNTIHSIELDQAEKLEKFDHSTKRKASMINVGGIITEMEWLSHDIRYEGSTSILAVAVVPKLKDHYKRYVDMNLSVHKFQYSSFHSFIKLFQVDFSSGEIKPLSYWVFENWGPVRQMKFMPCKGNFITLGVLFGDGKFRVFPVEGSVDATNICFKRPSIEIGLPKPHFMSCFDYLDSKTLIFGTHLGYLGQLTIEYDYKINFLVQKHQNLVRKIAIQHQIPSYCPAIMISQCMAGSVLTTHLTDVYITGHSNQKKMRKLVIASDYFPCLHAFGMQHMNFVRAYSVRAPDGASPFVIKHLKNAVATSVSGSQMHPYVISGADCGELLLSNSFIPISYASRDIKNKPIQARVWAVEYNMSLDIFKFSTKITLRNSKALKRKSVKPFLEKEQMTDEELSNFMAKTHKQFPTEIKKIEQLVDDDNYEPEDSVIYPVEVSFVKAKWCETRQGSDTYAAALSRDVVIIDKAN